MRKKFRSWDERFLSKRSEFTFKKDHDKGDWDLIDHFPLYVGQKTLARYLAIYDIFKSCMHVPGDLAEFGSWKGANILYLCKLLNIYSSYTHKEIHCFDTFEGLQLFDTNDHDASNFKDSFAGSLCYMESCLNLFEYNDLVHTHKGDIAETFPSLMQSRPELVFSLVYFDTDLYQPTATVLEYILERTFPGAKIVFDEWNDEWFPGEGVAANEFIRKYSDYFSYDTPLTTPAPSLILTRK